MGVAIKQPDETVSAEPTLAADAETLVWGSTDLLADLMADFQPATCVERILVQKLTKILERQAATESNAEYDALERHFFRVLWYLQRARKKRAPTVPTHWEVLSHLAREEALDYERSQAQTPRYSPSAYGRARPPSQEETGGSSANSVKADVKTARPHPKSQYEPTHKRPIPTPSQPLISEQATETVSLANNAFRVPRQSWIETQQSLGKLSLKEAVHPP